MRPYTKFYRESLYVVVLLSFGGSFFISKDIAFAAEDSLLSLQQDVLAAKQKTVSLQEKSAQLQQMISTPTAVKLKQDADNLMSELSQRGIISSSSKEIAPSQKIDGSNSASKLDYPSPRSFKVKQGLEPYKPWVLDPMPKVLGFGVKDYSGRLTEGQAAYKVAVADGKISIKEAVAIASANSIQAEALQKKVEVARAKLTEARRALLPTVQFQYEDNGGRNPGGSGGNRLYKGRNKKVNINQPLYYGGELVLTVKQAEENVKSAQADLEKAKGELAQQVVSAYYVVVKNEYHVQYQIDALKEVSELYKVIQAAHAEGLIPQLDYLNAESQFHQASFSVESTYSDLRTAYLTLRQSMNLESEEDLLLDLKLDIPKIDADYKKLVEVAMENNPEILSKQLAFLSAQDGVAIYEAKKKPRFDLRGSYGYLGEHFTDSEAQTDEDQEKLPQKREWFAGIRGSIPFGANSMEFDMVKHQYGPTVSAFQGSTDWRRSWKFNLLDKFQDITDAKNAEAVLSQAEADWQKARNDTAFKLKEAFYSMQKALIQIDSTMARIRYQEKQNGILKYTTSLQETPAANYLEGLSEQVSNRFAFIQAVTDYHVAIANIGVACGDPFYFEKEKK